MRKRIDAYSQILKNINYIEQNIDKDDILLKSNTEQAWLSWYSYCSKEQNQHLYMFIKDFNKKEN